MQQTAKPEHEVWEPPRYSQLVGGRPALQCATGPQAGTARGSDARPGQGANRSHRTPSQKAGGAGKRPCRGHTCAATRLTAGRASALGHSRYASGQPLAIPAASRTTMDCPLQLWLGAWHLGSSMPRPPAAGGTPVCPELGRGSEPHLCDGELLLRHVAGHVDHLHPVPQRLGDGLGDVGRADEQHLGRPAGRFQRTSPPASPRWARLPGRTHTLDRSTGTSK